MPRLRARTLLTGVGVLHRDLHLAICGSHKSFRRCSRSAVVTATATEFAIKMTEKISKTFIFENQSSKQYRGN